MDRTGANFYRAVDMIKVRDRGVGGMEASIFRGESIEPQRCFYHCCPICVHAAAAAVAFAHCSLFKNSRILGLTHVMKSTIFWYPICHEKE